MMEQALLVRNLLDPPNGERSARDPAVSGEEYFESLLTGPSGLRVERILSRGQTSGEGFYYEQEQDEWVLVMEGAARIACEDGRQVDLKRGDALFLPKKLRHRVSFTSDPCFWLAIHGHGLKPCPPAED
ncbi:cupin domain-containing protein [Desulfovibrio sp. OttesenSCG-928-A18]|nr:cupin domain-containing protein [Desulfovibrio sp. OttesenSCG-928-A18]